MHAHVAHDAVAVLHERPPAARVNQFVVGPEGRRSSPCVVVEMGGRLGVRGIGVGAHVVVAADLDMADVAQQARFDDLLFGLH